MSHTMTVQEMIEKTKQLQQRFQTEQEQRPWTIDTYVMELLAEAGTLADTIVIKEGYRKLRANQDIDLEDDIADLLFVVFTIAEHYGISIEHAYQSMLDATFAKLDNRKQQTDSAG
ncbi:MAG: hypothetical protein IAE80_01755 [Anaerolinea sp.]|nr:hypothetical protein [Anaerolinea sp.]